MLIPFLTIRESSDAKRARDLYRRKGGGGGGKGGGGKGGGSTGGGKGSGSTGSGGGTPIPITGKTPTGKGSASTYGNGGGKVSTIPAGAAFAGRSLGGGTRGQVYGTSAYGSGYPGVATRGVAGRGFPFFFWPIVWGGAAGGAAEAYLHDSGEYGDCSNSSRPGGAMTQATFVSNSTAGTTFYLLADNSTVAALITTIDANCSSSLASSSSTVPTTFNCSSPSAPQPEQAIQYYRASSVVLALSGYNNSAVSSDNSDENAAATPLPSGIDTTLLTCLNLTIGASVPLVNAAGPAWAGSGMSVVGLFWVFWFLLGNVL